MNPLRILCLANVPRDLNSGAAGAELETILALRELGHVVEDVWSDTIGRRIPHGNLHQLLELPGRYAAIVDERLSRSRFDVVHVNQPHGYLAARRVRRHWPEAVFIHRSHGLEPRVEETLRPWRAAFEIDRRHPLRRAASALVRPLLAKHDVEIARWADGHIVCSTLDASFLVERFGVDERRVAALPQAAPSVFLEPARPMDAARLRTVLYVGQYAFVKAPMIVAAAMAAIAERRSDARLIWVSGKEHHAAIRSLVPPRVAERIELLPWFPQQDLREVFDSAGIFLFPSFFEGSGKAHIEALSRGLCVVASRTGGMIDMITSGVDGVLVTPGDASETADAALRLMADPGAAHAMSTAAAARAREFSWQRTAIETADFYRRIMALGKVGP